MVPQPPVVHATANFSELTISGTRAQSYALGARRYSATAPCHSIGKAPRGAAINRRVGPAPFA
jgi:hypothetical protein